ncbi:MAG: TraR/DksA family transcriptional regulator [Aquabacterium sp.]
MSTHLTPGQKALLHTELTSRQTRLREQLDAHLHGQTRAERAHEVLTQDGDDAPQRAPEREVAMALTDHERAALAEVTAALERLSRGAYGRCADCGEDIAFDRLKVEPEARRCIGCASAAEKGR